MLLFSSRGALDFPVPTRPVHRAVKLNQFPARIRHSQARQKLQTAFPARIRHSQARHFATNCRPGTSIHPQTLLTDRCEVHFGAGFRHLPLLQHFLHLRGASPKKHRGPAPSAATLCSLGAEGGTRLSVSGDSVWSRCRRRDETADFGLIRVVSVSKEGRDCRFQGILCGLGAGRGTRPPGVGESERSKGREWSGGGAEGAQKAETPGQGPGVSE